VKFGSADELPEDIKKQFFAKIKDGLAAKPTHSEGQKAWNKKMSTYIEPGFEVYATLENILAVSLKTRLPGFARHAFKNQI
jgi:hypothetical protein